MRDDVPAGYKVLPCDIKLKQNRREDDSTVTKRAMLRIGGHRQQYKAGPDEIFAPVADFQTIRLMLSISAKEGMISRHVDVKRAFLYSDIDGDVYMEQPREVLRFIPSRTGCASC